VCNDFGNRVPHDEYLRAFSEIRVPLRWPTAAPNLEPQTTFGRPSPRPLFGGARMGWSWRKYARAFRPKGGRSQDQIGTIAIGPDRHLTAWASIFICLGLTACLAPTIAPPWVKAGADSLTIEREVHECEAQSNDAFASERAIIDKKVGLSWMLQGFVVVPFQRQTMLQEAAKRAKEVFDNCMRTKGFTKED
jgi:hypothetical protein